MIDIKYYPPGMPEGWVFTIDEKTILRGLLMQSVGKRLEIAKKLLESVKENTDDKNDEIVKLKYKEIEELIKIK